MKVTAIVKQVEGYEPVRVTRQCMTSNGWVDDPTHEAHTIAGAPFHAGLNESTRLIIEPVNPKPLLPA